MMGSTDQAFAKQGDTIAACSQKHSCVSHNGRTPRLNKFKARPLALSIAFAAAGSAAAR
jgi:hypothetical protein